MIEFILRGGVFLWPIGLLSVGALYLIIERAIFFLQSRPAPQLQRALNDFLGGEPPVDLAETLAESSAPEAKLAQVGLLAEGADAGDAHRRLERALLEVVATLEHNVAPLASIANVATHLGLLGTVVGMIAAFIGMGGVATADLTGLTQGISQALITTAAGLGVAVPASFFHHLYANHVKKRIAELNVTTSELESLVVAVTAAEPAVETAAEPGR